MNKTRIDFALDSFTVTCPKCHSGLIQVGGVTSTMVAFSDLDTNHKSRGCNCTACGFEFMLESCGFNYWVSDLKRNVFRGIANCCGSEYHYLDRTLYEDADLHRVNDMYLNLPQSIENTLSPQKLNEIYLHKGSIKRKENQLSRNSIQSYAPITWVISEKIGIGIIQGSDLRIRDGR